VVSFNIRYGTAEDGPNHWEHRKAAVFRLLREYQADVMGLQEALAFQVEEIRRVFPEYGCAVVYRDDGKQAGESCPIFYRRERFRQRDGGTFWFSDTPEVPGSKHWGNSIPRICTWICLEEAASRRPLYIYNVHLDHQSQSSREKSVQLLVERLNQLPAGSAVVVMGDFNMELSNPAMRPLWDQKGSGLIETWQKLHEGQQPVGTWHDFGRRFGTAKIDHIFVPAWAAVLEAEIDQRLVEGRYSSDHFPVWAVVQWSPQTGQSN
jgi:endonuclease/exonuclease/phosphatase family metal-dependent hydrolase